MGIAIDGPTVARSTNVALEEFSEFDTRATIGAAERTAHLFVDALALYRRCHGEYPDVNIAAV
jgi:hypothetical protein